MMKILCNARNVTNAVCNVTANPTINCPVKAWLFAAKTSNAITTPYHCDSSRKSVQLFTGTTRDVEAEAGSGGSGHILMEAEARKVCRFI